MDWLLMIAIFTLLILGLAAIYSVELSQDAGTFLDVKKQLVAVGLASILCFFVSFSNYQLLRNYSILLYVMGITLLIGVLIFGETIRGAQGWFVFGSVSFQPVEFMKVVLIIALATYFSTNNQRPLRFKHVAISILIMALPVFLVLLQPDLGSASMLVGIWFFVALFAGMRWRDILLFGAAGVLTSVLSWMFFLVNYQRERILTFLDPTYDPLGQGYNVTQAIIAIGSGGWFGSGLGFGTQSHLKFLPESQTDFIFAVIAEELGFVGVTIVLAAFVLLFARVFLRASRASDDFTGFLLLGVGSLLFLQFFVNIGMNLGLFPVTGIGLPFVSYGGSSMIFLLLLIAMVQSVAIRDRGIRKAPGSVVS